MRSVVVPTLTTFGRSRTWTKGQISMSQSAQNYALQRVFGLDKLAMHELHITTEQLHRAALWPTIQQVLMRMPIDRLPKLALFGAWVHNTRSPTKTHTQTYWISEVLRTADIHPLDFFRLAQNRDPTKWDALIKQAFPRRTPHHVCQAGPEQLETGPPSP